ncbi:MAG: LacI family DNA-binding transcriptional regulator [Lentisphaeria bacterium]|nr:LacI family DNA-binding transcriptional regulator [Lentisphaeria bacterium]
MAITMKELAKMLNLSQSTVSRALNHKEGSHMRPEVGAMIREAARRAGFHPNMTATALRKGSTDLIAVSLPSPFIMRNAELSAALHHEIKQNGYIPFFVYHEDYEDLHAKTNMLLSMGLAGLITIEPNSLPVTPEFPVVGFCYYDDRFDVVQPDQKQAIRKILAHLQENGHRYVAVIGHAGDMRYNHFFNLLNEYGLECPQHCCIFFSGDRILFNTGSQNFFDQLMQQCQNKERPTAIITHNDQIAIRLMTRIQQQGFSIPGDFSIIGYDDTNMAQCVYPTLTSLSPGHPGEVAKTMLSLLLDRKKDPSRPLQRVSIQPDLIIRNSSGPAPQK